MMYFGLISVSLSFLQFVQLLEFVGFCFCQIRSFLLLFFEYFFSLNLYLLSILKSDTNVGSFVIRLQVPEAIFFFYQSIFFMLFRSRNFH